MKGAITAFQQWSSFFQAFKLWLPQIVKRYAGDVVGKGYGHQTWKVELVKSAIKFRPI